MERTTGAALVAAQALWACAAACWPVSVSAAEQAGQTIYTCTDDRGRKLTSDRPIPECTAKEQRVLNRDGSLRTVQPPTLTAEERADKEARERRAAELRSAQAEAVRRDKALLGRYRDDAAHRRAREAALDTVRLAIKASDKRLKDLEVERRPLVDEAEFYKGRTMPAKLKAALEANDVAFDAQRTAVANQEAELVRVNQMFDIELARLQRLWGGAAPGSLGPLPAPGSAAALVKPASQSRPASAP